MRKVYFLRNVAISFACLAAIGVTSVKAQNAKFTQTPVTYFEEYDKGSGKLISKQWRSGNNLRSESVNEMTGKTILMILRGDSMKCYSIDTEKKTFMALPLSMFTDGYKSAANNVIGFDFVEQANTTKTFLRDETVEGFDCKVYEIKTTETVKGGNESTAIYVCNWVYEPYNMWVQQKQMPYGETVVRRNFKTTPQPAELFEIKKEWKGQTLPAGGLMEMLGGKSRSENQKEADNAQKGLEDLNKKMEDLQKKTEGMSDAEKLQEALKMLGGSQGPPGDGTGDGYKQGTDGTSMG
ncbi:MAG: hypothetical protein LBR49_04005 [Tannerella sp.]|jgi:hypothetical protein|nr:hypothetical protein [Tannerella sp.]